MTPEDVNPQVSAALVRAVDGLHATVYMSGGTGRIEPREPSRSTHALYDEPGDQEGTT